MKNKLLFAVVLVLMGGLFACEDDNNPVTTFEAQLEKDQNIIDKYLADNNIDAEITPVHGLRYVINKQGTGEFPLRTDSVTVSYSGRKINEEEPFESNEDVTFFLGSVITGWQIGMQLIQEGGEITLYIPSGYAYGRAGSGGNIGPNANLVFTVELQEIK